MFVKVLITSPYRTPHDLIRVYTLDPKHSEKCWFQFIPIHKLSWYDGFARCKQKHNFDVCDKNCYNCLTTREVNYAQ